MVSKPLLKQSLKANKIIWLLVTLATCIMLASIIVIMGSAGVSQIRDSLTGVFVNNVANTEITEAPVYENTAHGSEILPVDPWARARDKSGVKTWRGSGQHGKLNYIGEATTYGTAMGQEMIAPEVNRHNMLVMTQHLRDLGYDIPADYDEKIKNLPQSYAKHLREAYDGLGHQNNPFDTMFSGFIDVVEDQTGLDMENILFNSIDLLSTD